VKKQNGCYMNCVMPWEWIGRPLSHAWKIRRKAKGKKLGWYEEGEFKQSVKWRQNRPDIKP
jgi:hypothetical protein